MFESVMGLLRQFVGHGLLRVILFVSTGIVVLAVAGWLSPAFRRGFRRLEDGEGWRGTLAGVATGVFKFLLLAVLTRLIVTGLQYQATVFEQQHGRITERNRSAVLMKWGQPHEQRELDVSHTKRRTWVTRQLKAGEGPEAKLVTESFWKDKVPPVQPVDGRLPSVVSTQEEERDVPVEMKSIVSADVEIGVRNNPRTLGNANYAGYDDAWKLAYRVANPSAERTTAHLSFSLPAEAGLFDEMYVRVDGSNVLDVVRSEGSALRWELGMPAGAQAAVEIGYRSRGLEHLRYIPRRMTQTGHYRVTMTVDGIPADKLDYPIGSMPAAERLADIRGSSYTLTWKLDNALTSYDIGVKLPLAEQPAYHFATLLREAPVGLALLLLLLVLPRLIAGVPVSPGLVALMAMAYALFYTFMGRLADLLPGFAGPFAIAAGALLGLVGWFRSRDTGSPKPLRCQDVACFGALAVLYPLAVVDAERTPFWMQCFDLGILIYVCALVIRFRRRSGTGSSGGPAG